jgi:hypothetical protein
MTKIEEFQQEVLTKNKILNLINAKEYAGALEVYKKSMHQKIIACLLFHGLRKSRHMCNIIFMMMLR